MADHEGIRGFMLQRLGESSSHALKDRSFEDQVMAMENLKRALNDEDEGISRAVRALETFIRVTMKKIEAESES